MDRNNEGPQSSSNVSNLEQQALKCAGGSREEGIVGYGVRVESHTKTLDKI